MFESYTNEALSEYNSAVTKLWLAGHPDSDIYKLDVMASGAEMTLRGMW